MGGTFGNLKLFADGPPGPDDATTPQPFAVPAAARPDGHLAATRELIRPLSVRRARRECEPFTDEWFEELELKRYQRHGAWLERALEFGRHPDQSVLVLGPGAGTDAVRYARHGMSVTVGTDAADWPGVVRDNFNRANLRAEIAELSGPRVPFADASFDVVALNALYAPALPTAERAGELFRVLRPGGKLIGLFPAFYDCAFWQGALLPLVRLWWTRPADPATAPKTTGRELRHLFAQFGEHRVSKRHLRRGELPHLWRVLPLFVLERWIGRVLVLKAKKPIFAARRTAEPLRRAA